MSEAKEYRMPLGWLQISLILFGIFLTILFLVLLFDRLETPLDKDTSMDLLGKDVGKLELECIHDFWGLSSHGGYFDFYKYTVKGNSFKHLMVDSSIYSYPLFKHGIYQNIKPIDEKKSIRWLATPIREDHLYNYLAVAGFGNLLDYPCSKELVDRNFINQKGNFYSYSYAKELGLYFYILVPYEKALYVIRKSD